MTKFKPSGKATFTMTPNVAGTSTLTGPGIKKVVKTKPITLIKKRQ